MSLFAPFTMATSQITTVTNGGISLSGGSLTFAGLTDANGTSLID